jgi:hypothetical protein
MKTSSSFIPTIRTHWFGSAILLGALVIFFWATSIGWSHRLTDSHSSRQTQTAITATLLYEQGPIPLTPFNGLGAPWSVPMEFPTYQLATAFTAHLTGGDIVSAGRLVSVLFGLIALPALWLILGRLNLGITERCIVLALLIASPLYTHYSRALLIETTATALACWWLAAFIEALHRGSLERAWLFSATIIGVFAALTKVTTFAVFLAPALVVLIARWRSTDRTTLYRAAFMTVPAIVAALWWTHAGDVAKAAHPYADFLTSVSLREWNWGTLAQRMDPAWWARFAHHLELVAPAWAYVAVLLGLVWGNRIQRFGILISIVMVLLGPLAFANLYYVHDYYFVATAPAIIFAIGLGFVALWQRFASRRVVRAVIGLTVVGAMAAQGYAFRHGFGHTQSLNLPSPEFADLLRDLTVPSDKIILFGREWDSALTYYTERAMAGVRETHETDNDAWLASRAALAPRDYTVLVAFDSIAGDTPFIHHRCRELGLLTDPVASTEGADIYVNAATRDHLAPLIAQLKANGRILATRPDRMGPGESRLEFVAADWQPLALDYALEMFGQVSPLPDLFFKKYDPAQMPVDDELVLHLHPPGAFRFNALSHDRVVNLEYGILPEIWLKNRDTDGVRFRAYIRGPDHRARLAWSHFVQPITHESERGTLATEIALPAHHTFELQIDAGPDHNPGYDWSYLKKLQIKKID